MLKLQFFAWRHAKANIGSFVVAINTRFDTFDFSEKYIDSTTAQIENRFDLHQKLFEWN